MKTSGREVLGMACISESHPTGCTFHHALISLTEMCQPLWTVDWHKFFHCLQVSRFINLWFICGWPKLVGAFQKYYVYVLRWNCFVKISFWCWSHFGLKSDTLWQNGAPLLTDRGTPAPITWTVELSLPSAATPSWELGHLPIKHRWSILLLSSFDHGQT